MKIPSASLVLAALLLPAAAASAQIAVYGTVNVERMTGIPYSQGSSSFTNGNFDAVGGTGGVFYDFRTIGPIRLGVDARASLGRSSKSVYTNSIANGSRLDSGLGGLRASFHLPFVPLKPYVEGLAGVARTNFGAEFNNATSPLTNNTGLSTHLEYKAVAGLDFSILPILDFRVVELGYGGVRGTSGTYPVGSISTGIVLHLPFGLGKLP